jgi:methionyl-tRNA formyltransferase
MLVVCPMPKKAGRGLVVKDSSLKLLALKNKIEVKEVEKLDETFLDEIKKENPEFLLIASFGKILPKSFLNFTKYGVLNIHPSLLPKYRGPSPIQYQILNNEQNVGVTIMKMDEEVDHGDIVSQIGIVLPGFHLSYDVLEEILAKAGAKLFAKDIEDYLSGKLKPTAQNHNDATFTKLFKKEDGLIDFKDDNLKKYLKYLALKDTVGVYFFENHKGLDIRVKITEATFQDEIFAVKRVIPEGKKEMTYEAFKNGLK